MASALFDIENDGEDQGYDATSSTTLHLRLRSADGVTGVQFQVWDPDRVDPSLGPDENPPRKSKGAPLVDLDNGVATGKTLSPVGLLGELTLHLEEDVSFAAWIVRVVVNGGKTQIAGRIVDDPSLVHERMIVVRDEFGARPIIATETTQYEDDGWAAAFVPGPEGATGPTGPTGATGATGAAFAPATGTANGYLSRTVLTSNTTFTTAADLPDGNFFDIYLYGPGGGAGSGHVDNSGNPGTGGSAGSGGGRKQASVSRALLVAMLPFTVTLPAGGAGGAAVTSSGVAFGNDGASPSGPATFGNLLTAYAGAHGWGGFPAGGGYAGGAGGAGAISSGNAAEVPSDETSGGGTGGRPNGGATGQDSALGGGGGGDAGSGGGPKAGGASVSGGGGGGGAGVNSVGGAGGQSVGGGSGGGGGGGFNTARTNSFAGGAGGASDGLPGAVAGVPSGPINGATGIDANETHGGLGGGGGASVTGASNITAGDGGDGGAGGGGGGGGGAAGSTGAGTNHSGKGGKGGDARCILVARV